MDVVTKSQDQLTRILDGLNQIQEQNEKRWIDFDAIFTEKFEEMKARIETLEDKSTNPTGQRVYVSPYGDGESRRQALYQFINAAYNRHYGFQFDEKLLYGERAPTAQQYNTTNRGDTLVPDPLAAEIVRIVENNGVARKIFRNIPMTADVQTLPTKFAGPTAAFIDEADVITASSVVFKNITLTAKKLAAIDEFSWELEQDAILPLAPLLVDLFSEAMAAKEDSSCFSGTSPWTGIFSNTDIVTVVTSGTDKGTISYDNLVDVMHTPDVNVQANGSFLCHPNVLAVLRKIKDDQNNPIWAPMTAGEPSTILGRPYILANQAPSASGQSAPLILYGDFKKYAAMGLRNDLSVAFDGSLGFKNATRYMRVMERIAFATLDYHAFGRIDTKA